jgi:hypothetical protein
MIWFARTRRYLGFGSLLLLLVLILAPIAGVLFPQFLLSLRDDTSAGWVANRLGMIGKFSFVAWVFAWITTWCNRFKNRDAR